LKNETLHNSQLLEFSIFEMIKEKCEYPTENKKTVDGEDNYKNDIFFRVRTKENQAIERR